MNDVAAEEQQTWSTVAFPKWDGLKPTDGKVSLQLLTSDRRAGKLIVANRFGK